MTPARTGGNQGLVPGIVSSPYSTFSIKWEFDKMGISAKNPLLFIRGKMGIV